MNPLLPVSSISQINDFENYFQLFFKIFYGSSIYRKRNNKELFFLMIMQIISKSLPEEIILYRR